MEWRLEELRQMRRSAQQPQVEVVRVPQRDVMQCRQRRQTRQRRVRDLDVDQTEAPQRRRAALHLGARPEAASAKSIN